MQYILSKEELDELKHAKSMKEIIEVDKVQELCSKIANEMPVQHEWSCDKTPRPWDCIITEEDEHYCDDCPVNEICPYDDKEWSK
jgi:hypothetical protein